MTNIKITYDKHADAAYMYLIPGSEIKEGWVKNTYPCDIHDAGSIINLDFNEGVS